MLDPNSFKNKIIYHYTDFLGFNGIFTAPDKDGGLRLCNIFTMNDLSEGLFYFDIIEQAVEKALSVDSELLAEQRTKLITEAKDLFATHRVRARNEHIYAACFSKLEDDAAQWERYGNNGAGVCIGFRADKLWELTNPLVIKAMLQPVYYIEHAEKSEYTQLIIALLKGEDAPGFNSVDDVMYSLKIGAAAHKHPSFKPEQEVRLLTWPDLKKDSLNYLITSKGIKDYYTVNLRRCCDDVNLGISDLVEKIIIGPKAMQNIDLFENYLEQQNLSSLCRHSQNDRRIAISQCPLR